MRLENILNHRKKNLIGLCEYYAYEKTPEGTAELDKLYSSKEEHKKNMDAYHKDLESRGILP